MKFKKVEKILVPVDFSTTSNKAFAYAREMTKAWDGELHLLHVLDTEFLTGAVHITIEPLDDSSDVLDLTRDTSFGLTWDRDSSSVSLSYWKSVYDSRQPFAESADWIGDGLQCPGARQGKC